MLTKEIHLTVQITALYIIFYFSTRKYPGWNLQDFNDRWWSTNTGNGLSSVSCKLFNWRYFFQVLFWELVKSCFFSWNCNFSSFIPKRFTLSAAFESLKSAQSTLQNQFNPWNANSNNHILHLFSIKFYGNDKENLFNDQSMK